MVKLDWKFFIIIVLVIFSIFQTYRLERKFYNDYKKQQKRLELVLDSLTKEINKVDTDIEKLKKVSYKLKNELKKEHINISHNVELDSIKSILKGYNMPDEK